MIWFEGVSGIVFLVVAWVYLQALRTQRKTAAILALAIDRLEAAVAASDLERDALNEALGTVERMLERPSPRLFEPPVV